MVDSVILSDRVSLGFSGGPTFATEKLQMVNGRIRRMANRSLAIHVYTFSYKNQPNAVIEELRGIFYDRMGDLRTFLLKDFSDYIATDEVFGLGDGNETAFQLIKTYTAGYNPYERPIRHIKAGTLVLKRAGVEVSEGDSPTEVTVSSTGLVTFTTAPSVGQELTWSGEFYVPVNFDGDQFSVETNYTLDITVKTLPALTAIEAIP